MPDMTWEELVQREPRLVALLREAQAIRDTGGSSFCANAVWYGDNDVDTPGLKAKLCRLVGWEAQKQNDPILGSEEAYDLAYETVYDALPPCRNCQCLW